MQDNLGILSFPVGSYIVATASRLRQSDSSSGELVLSKVERDELKVRLLELEGEKRSFEERYDVLAGEKASLQDQLEEEIARRKVVEEDLGWLLQKGIVRVVDKVVKSAEFSLGVRQIKMACVAIGVENGKQVILEQVVDRIVFREPDTTVEHAQVMHATVKIFHGDRLYLLHFPG
ncbi:unnamed protein product [Lactuca saligna]|uniref:Uncharacterized protein n=1 Tax=Lactuca saligna TaxID=75948 RepID=A0AA35ZYP4_LACSI|nr:unnamed protein product [Lactuca saligna]